jgi:hypothetical protein
MRDNELARPVNPKDNEVEYCSELPTDWIGDAGRVDGALD